MKISKFFLIISCVVTFIGCKKKEVDPSAFDFNHIDIKDSTQLIFIQCDESKTILANTDGNELYAISKTGKVSKISLNNTKGGDVSDVLIPGQIANATPKYMLVNFTRNGSGSPSEGYLWDKQTGEVTTIGGRFTGPVPFNGRSKTNPFAYYDGSKYLYFGARPNSIMDYVGVARLDVNSKSKENIINDSIQRYEAFDVDKDRNFLTDPLWTDVAKRRMTVFNNTTKYTFPFVCVEFWVANDGNFRYRLNNKVYLLKYDSPSKKFVTTEEIDMSNIVLDRQLYKEDCYIVYYNNKTIIVRDYEILEFDHVAKKVKEISTVPLLKSKWLDHSKALGHLYVAGESASGQETIFNIDLSNYSYTTYPQAGKYSFYEIEAFEDGTIYATAKRKSDSKNVILKFAPDGTETVLYDQLGTTKGVWLEKVTEFVND